MARIALAMALALAAGLMLAGCERSDAAASEDKSKPVPAAAEDPATTQGVPVEIETITRGDIARALRLTGTLQARRSAVVPARVEGIIAEVMVQVGDRVAAGDELARLETQDIEIELAESASLNQQAAHTVAERRLALSESGSRLQQARREHERAVTDNKRQESLFARALVPEETVEGTRLNVEKRSLEVEAASFAVDRAQVELQLAESRVATRAAAHSRLELRRDRHVMRAPFAGVVAEVNADPHALTFSTAGTGRESSPLFRIMDLGALLLELRVPEASIALLAAGRDLEDESGRLAWITSESHAELRTRGRVTLVAPVIDPNSGTVLVEVSIDPATGSHLHPGMFVSCAIEVERHDGVLIAPRRGLVHDEGNPVLYIVNAESRAQRVPLRGRILLEDDLRIEIDHPLLPEGTRVIVVGQSSLKDGSRVTVVESRD